MTRVTALFGSRIGDAAKIRQAHLPAARQNDLCSGQLIDCTRTGQCADGLLAPGNFTAPACQIDIGSAQLPVHIASSHAQRQKAINIKLDQDFTVNAADARHRADALDALQPPGDHIIDEP